MENDFIEIREIPYPRKCNDLIKNYEELLEADKARKENR